MSGLRASRRVFAVTGVAGGTVITSPGWSAATSMLDVDAAAGVSRLLVSRYPAGS